jgi:uncharacterized protein with FMN-binding domain
MRRVMVFFGCAIFLCFAGTFTYSFDGELSDGAYEGECSFVSVEVAVADGKMENIDMVEHGGGGAKYASMIEPMINDMLKKQSTDVDVVTGATVSSENLKKAVDRALSKARN